MKMKLFPLLVLLSLIVTSCKKENETVTNPSDTVQYSISGRKIYNYENPVQLIGANAFHIFDAGSSDMNSWNIDIAGEFVGNVNETPLSGWAIEDINGSFLHSLQAVVDSNRLNNRVTILCPFGWNGQSETVFSGKMPSETYWWNDFKIKLQQWAIQFKDQPDVWIELWNEPYRWDRTDGYTDEIWLSDMNVLVDIIREAGNDNIIVVPCAEQGQDESVLNNKGSMFLINKKNILFDIHAYEKWLLVSDTEIDNRLEKLKQNNLPVIFGEIGPVNAGVLMNPKTFLDIIHNRGLSVCAWVWKYDSNDNDALLNEQSLPNDKDNNNWGTTFQSLSLQSRMP
jgi:mannan endo-1,4-beta-mannosidase